MYLRIVRELDELLGCCVACVHVASHPVGISHIPSHFVERKAGQALAGWAHILPYQDIS